MHSYIIRKGRLDLEITVTNYCTMVTHTWENICASIRSGFVVNTRSSRLLWRLGYCTTCVRLNSFMIPSIFSNIIRILRISSNASIPPIYIWYLKSPPSMTCFLFSPLSSLSLFIENLSSLIVSMGYVRWQYNTPKKISPFLCEILVKAISQSACDDCSIEVISLWIAIRTNNNK